MYEDITLDPEPRAVLGCIQIGTDFVLDSVGPELISLIPGVELRLQKVKLADERICPDTYLRSKSAIGEAVSCLQPSSRCTVLGLACTSFSFTLGPAAVDEELGPSGSSVPKTDMARALVAAIKALGVRKVALLTPYIEELSKLNAEYIEKSAGVEVVSRLTMGIDRDETTSRVDSDTIIRWAKRVNVEEADVIIIGCSSLRVPSIDRLELSFSKPVLTSCQCFLWHMLRLAGVNDKVPGYGKLLSEPFPSTS